MTIPIKIKSYHHLISIIGIEGLNQLKCECEEIKKEHNHILITPPPHSFKCSIKVYRFDTQYSIQVENAKEVWYLISK